MTLIRLNRAPEKIKQTKTLTSAKIAIKEYCKTLPIQSKNDKDNKAVKEDLSSNHRDCRQQKLKQIELQMEKSCNQARQSDSLDILYTEDKKPFNFMISIITICFIV